MDTVYKKFIISSFLLLITIKVISFFKKENFSNIIDDNELKKRRKTREEPPFEITDVKINERVKSIPQTANEYNNEYYNSKDGYILIPTKDRSKWRRERDEHYDISVCNRLCEIKSTDSPYKSYMEMNRSEYGIIKPNVYSHKPGKQLEVSNTDRELVKSLPTPKELPYTRATRAEWVCQREWQCFDPNTILNSDLV